ncbi:transglutaminase TgpA family protein [Isoalcanivorax indicus]|uniref:transglutaminase TgpA family protein n=1 Tax=Isoalcanivorax indicus TaxID=2202653 RepID=UPI000DB9631E|nr:DUF3488 and transglutaminase-like domain-containing protein [Isoalcanivorax indicus]
MRVYQVPHHTFWLLTLGTFLAALPHLWMGPLWLQLLIPALLVARVLVQRGRLRMPGRSIRVLLLGGIVAGTVYSHGTIAGPEAGACLLVAAFGLKLLEMFRLRDAYVLLVLGYFVLATTFLFYQGPLAAFYVLLAMLLLTAALVGINKPETRARASAHVRLASVMLLQALPLMLLLFVLVPRVGPLWALEIRQEQARTGMSDSMAPGEVSHLTQSAELAFRVEFDGEVPPPAARYWRGLTYSWFDGRRWSQASPREIPRDELVQFAQGPGNRGPANTWYPGLSVAREQVPGPVYRYRVVQEPSRRPWLYALAVPFAEQRDIGLVRDFRLVRDADLEQRYAYTVTSYPLLKAAMPLPDWERDFNLSLPESGNGRSRLLAEDWFRRAEGDPRRYAERILRWFREEAFFYTLEPPLLRGDTVDAFLFDSRRGFCEHYASAFAYLMRAAGVPARIVAGYQGGELNPMGNHLRVHQYHAHAWVEIWIEGEGWVEYDPTGAVAPERIEQGMEPFRDGGGGGLQNLFGGRGGSHPMLARLRNSLDYIQFSWQKWVLGYDETAQLAFLERWLGEISPWRLAQALLIGMLILLLPVALWVLLRQRGPARSPLQREYHAMGRQLRRAGLPQPEHLPPRELAQRAGQLWPAVADDMRRWAGLYEQAAYAGDEATDCRRQLRRLRRQLRWRLRRAGTPAG